MRKYNVVEYTFVITGNMGVEIPPRVVAKGLPADKAQAKARSLNDERAGDGNIARAYRAEVATA